MVTEALTAVRPAQEARGCDAPEKLKRADRAAVDWLVSAEPVAYPDAVEAMRRRVALIAAGEARECVWLLEHPALYTAGTSARPEDILVGADLPVFESGRGGQVTYHGPGQRIAYVMLDLGQRGRDVRCFVQGLESWLIGTLAGFGIESGRRSGRVGVWVPRPDKGTDREDKIAAIGVRVSRWVSFHGISLNVAPDLSHYSGIVPCGITDQGITSFRDLGHEATMPQVDSALRRAFEARFGPTQAARADALVS